MDNMWRYLPQDIIPNILKRLPVKSLLRFRCVCRHWKNLIDNPSFILDHLQQSSHQNPCFLLQCLRWHFCLLDCRVKIREVLKAPLDNSDDSLDDSRIVGSCNGLLCVEFDRNDESPPSLSLWNPATRAVRHVFGTDCFDVFGTDCFDFDDWVTGFGFSPVVNDYKIVRCYADSHDAVNRAEVFSLSRGSWNGIDIGNLQGVKLNSETASANGAIFWSGVRPAEEEGEDGVKTIVSFDIANELFTLIPVPNLDYDIEFEKLTVHENKLALLRGGHSCDLIGLWVMEEGAHAFGDIWTNRYTRSPYSETLDPMTIWRNQIVCNPSIEYLDTKEIYALHLVNLATNEVERFLIPYCGPVGDIYNYVESLVSVGCN